MNSLTDLPVTNDGQENETAPAHSLPLPVNLPSGVEPVFSPVSAPNSTPRQSPNSASKRGRNGSLPIRDVNGGKRKTSAAQIASQLAVTETTYKGAKAWRVSLGKRGSNLISFRVRPAGSGFGVSWRSGSVERYVCYLSASEWGTARKGSPASFARLIVAKLEAKQSSGEDIGNLSGLVEGLRAFA